MDLAWVSAPGVLLAALRVLVCGLTHGAGGPGRLWGVPRAGEGQTRRTAKPHKALVAYPTPPLSFLHAGPSG